MLLCRSQASVREVSGIDTEVGLCRRAVVEHIDHQCAQFLIFVFGAGSFCRKDIRRIALDAEIQSRALIRLTSDLRGKLCADGISHLRSADPREYETVLLRCGIVGVVRDRLCFPCAGRSGTAKLLELHIQSQIRKRTGCVDLIVIN